MIPVTRVLDRMFGEPSLAAVNNASAHWIRGETSPFDQKSATGWLAALYGGVQTGDDWARVNIPVAELFVRDFNSALWSYYMTNTETMGVGIVIWAHDPNDYDNRIEITQLGGHADLAKASGWNAFSFDKDTGGMFFYGEGTTGTGLTAGTQYTWSQFQSDTIFSTWTIYRITFDYGWEASGTFETAYLADVKLNGTLLRLQPQAVDVGLLDFSEWKSTIMADNGTLSAEVNLGKPYKKVMLIGPAIVSGTLSINIAMTAGGTYYPIHILDDDATGSFLSATTAATTSIAIEFPVGAAQFVKVLSSVSQTGGPLTFYVRGIN